MSTRTPALLIAAATLAVGGLGFAASDVDPAPTASAGEVLCAHAEGPDGNRVGPEVCVPWFLPVP